jgi:hypothetical protein
MLLKKNVTHVTWIARAIRSSPCYFEKRKKKRKKKKEKKVTHVT